MEAAALGYPFGPFVRLLILTEQRRGEVATMRRHDVDLPTAMWTLSAEQTKPSRIHDVPLSRFTLPLPIKTKTLSMPGNHSLGFDLGFDDHQSRTPARPNPGKPNP
jgi:integrase